jgi:hypothetical protein
MNKKDEFRKEIERIWKILTLANECFHYSFYFYKPQTEKELKFIEDSCHIKFFRLILWRTTIIELAKLFHESKKSHRFNINHFIDKLKKEGQYGDMEVSLISIENWKAKIKANQDTIDTIQFYRDKVYAHDDPVDIEKVTEKKMSFKEIEKLTKIVKSIIKEIYITVLNTDPQIRTMYFHKDRFNLIDILAEEKENGIHKSIENLKNKK